MMRLLQRHKRRHRGRAVQRVGKFSQKHSGRAPELFRRPGEPPGQRLRQWFLQRARQHNQIVADTP
jgi:hypothetical protein